MPQPENDGRFADPTAALSAAALIETSLHQARIMVLHPSRVVIVGDGQRVRIDHQGVTRQGLCDLRLALPMPQDATVDQLLQGTLGRWAGLGTELSVHEVVHSGQRFTRTVHLTDVDGVQATLDHRSGRARA